MAAAADEEEEASVAAGGRCAVCRLGSAAGCRHPYGRAHQQRLREALARLRAKVQPARRAIRAAALAPYEAAEHERCCWCPCCGRDVRTHLRLGRLALLHAGLLQHLASAEHRSAAHRFWWENKAEPKLKHHFLVSPQDYTRFKSSLVKALDAYEEKEDKTIEEMASRIREVEESRRQLVQAALEPEKETEPCDGPSVFSAPGVSESDITCCTNEQPGPSGMQPLSDLDWMEKGHALTFIGHQETGGKGNIHTGAKPPWLVQDEEEVAGNKQQIGPSYEEFLKENISSKLKQGKKQTDRGGTQGDQNLRFFEVMLATSVVSCTSPILSLFPLHKPY
ncbi:centrosomal AT-AC splicing factor isoform X2 [Alligator mississippiensis]|uniref:centrosomal AT-AC splicing factor isoform X2 n=1 Tax=Alligator mississippiensis TaxID=8496 RepID=UPI0028777984|nr:centrosomal AT-AC splicing factor isoform X2 [Alligator mississippiensis]